MSEMNQYITLKNHPVLQDGDYRIVETNHCANEWLITIGEEIRGYGYGRLVDFIFTLRNVNGEKTERKAIMNVFIVKFDDKAVVSVNMVKHNWLGKLIKSKFLSLKFPAAIAIAMLVQGCSYHRARDMNVRISPQCSVMTELPGHYIYRCEYENEACFTSRSKWWSQSMDGEISCIDKTKIVINNNG